MKLVLPVEILGLVLLVELIKFHLLHMDGDYLEELDLRWQVAMLTVRVKKKGHFARECRSGRSQGRRSYGDNGMSNVPTNESSSQALVAQDGLGGYDWSNDFEVEPVNYALMAISSSSSSSFSDSEVHKCSKYLKSFKCLQKNYDTEREKHNKAKLEIRGYEIALESLESRIIGHEKNELAWGKKYEFQNYKLKCREIKINNLNLELEKVVKERDELKVKIENWEESTKNLEEILKSQMSARDKTGLGYNTQLNELSSNHETDSENSLSIFDGRSSDDEHIPENDRFSKNGYKAVPPPITGNFLTPRADISFAGLDEYAIRNKIIESQTTKLNNKTSETAGKTHDANTEKPKSVSESVVFNPKINRDSVIIEDWTSDDEEEVSGVQKVRHENQTVKTRDEKSGQILINKELERVKGYQTDTMECSAQIGKECENSGILIHCQRLLISGRLAKKKSTDKGKRYRRRARSMAKKIDTGLDAEEEINTDREEINIGIKEVSTGSTKVDSGTASKRGQRERKGLLMIDEDIPGHSQNSRKTIETRGSWIGMRL
ncbi:hypothetical protein Tco_1465239 [Tanacetum coccineum]